ncbi:MAG: hypothetical protein HC913_14325 [Microscillaceae bacterium]|nr:hypothetical protein [Microscillaceae bacterium]
MKLLDIILMSLATVFFIIGIDQTIRLQRPIVDSYWLFMVVAACLIWLNLRKFNPKKEGNTAPPPPTQSKPRRK